MENRAKTGQEAVSEVRCRNGHPNRPGEIFCQFCSAPLPTPEEIDNIVRQELEEEARLKNEVNKWFGKEGELDKFLSQIEVPLSLLLLGAAAWLLFAALGAMPGSIVLVLAETSEGYIAIDREAAFVLSGLGLIVSSRRILAELKELLGRNKE